MGKKSAQTLGISRNALTGAKVFIKLNVLTMGMDQVFTDLAPFDPGSGECTKPEIVFGIAEMCLEAGAAKVTIADGAQGISWDWAAIKFFAENRIHGATNIKSAVDYLKSKYGDSRVELLCLNQADEWAYIPSCSDASVMKDGLLVAKSFYEADHVITVPCPKTHVYTQMTASMKNYVGVIPIVRLGLGYVRSEAHKAYAYVSCGGVDNAGIAGAFIDIAKWRRDEGRVDFAIMDCTVGLEGNGPHLAPVNDGITIDHKERNRIGKYSVLASHSLASADSIAAQMMGFDVREVKQLTIANNLGLGEVSNVKLEGAELSDLVIAEWKKPELIEESFFDVFPAPIEI